MAKKKRNFVFTSTSKSLLDLVEGNPSRVRMFNFSDRWQDFVLNGYAGKKKIGAFDATWIRIYNDKNVYYDFVASSLFFVSNDQGLVVMCSENTQLLDSQFFATEIEKFARDNPKLNVSSNNQYIDEYYKSIVGEMKTAHKQLANHFKLEKQVSLGRLNVDDMFVKSKNELSKQYLKDLILSTVMRENKKEIINLIKVNL